MNVLLLDTCKIWAKQFDNKAIELLQRYTFPIEIKQIHFLHQHQRKQMQYSWEKKYVSNLILKLRQYLRMTIKSGGISNAVQLEECMHLVKRKDLLIHQAI